MKTIILSIVLVCPLFSSATVNLIGNWTTASGQCKVSGPVPAKIKPLLESLSMLFSDKTIVQNMTLMPNCVVSSGGTYQIVGDQIQFGQFKSTLSSGCPAGMTVKDKPPVTNRFRIDVNDLVIEVPAGFFCSQSNDILELRLVKNSRWIQTYRH